jgi:hypothetical protein
MSQAIQRLMKVTASTERASMTSGKRGTPTTKLASVLCLPIDPVPAGEARDHLLRMGLGSPIALYQTLTAGGQDIISGDTLTVGSQDYAIRLVETWAESTNLGDAYLRLILEKGKP